MPRQPLQEPGFGRGPVCVQASTPAALKLCYPPTVPAPGYPELDTKAALSLETGPYVLPHFMHQHLQYAGS